MTFFIPAGFSTYSAYGADLLRCAVCVHLLKAESGRVYRPAVVRKSGNINLRG